MFCRQQVAELGESYSAFQDKGARLVVVGSGEVAHLKDFKASSGFEGEIFTDPSRESFRLLGFRSGVSGLLGIKAISRGFSALKEGYTPGFIQGSALQLGGAVIIDTDCTMRYHYVGEAAGDHPPIKEMLNALD
ncbi:AhpC/TSA family protein [Desulfosediminicola flagellatus]|uniref:AhpC/TSA family protein n=1 Tax=Desulfosediminicola flagellatus TaxID=2569541 RepID=UPI0010ABAB42|nr:AhpC/TSA family protein [Desulfosediminicola flagellatus]